METNNPVHYQRVENLEGFYFVIGNGYETRCKHCGNWWRWIYEKGNPRIFCTRSCVFKDFLEQTREKLPSHITLKTDEIGLVILKYKEGESPEEIHAELKLPLDQINMLLEHQVTKSRHSLHVRKEKKPKLELFEQPMQINIESPKPEQPKVEQAQVVKKRRRRARPPFNAVEKAEIRSMFLGGIPQYEIAKKFHSTQSAISRIVCEGRQERVGGQVETQHTGVFSRLTSWFRS